MCKTEHRIEVDPEPGPSETQHMIGIADSLRQEISQLKSENARLLTDYRNLRETYSELYNELAKAQSAPMTRSELNELLAPTIRLLHDLQLDPDLADTRRVEEEIDRLKRVPV